tara:strand:+ start:390 stop:581 length:192 start_codon:yes stop_codon:yes gene_type:complete
MRVLINGTLFDSFKSYHKFISDFIEGQSDCSKNKDIQKKTRAYIRGYSAQDSLNQINAMKESK